jgi:hypothetical protein
VTAPAREEQTFLGTLGGIVLTSVPVVTTVVFFAVTLKVFRVANMDTATTVAVVSEADVVALLKGVVLTLLPGFLAALVSLSIWWWADELPTANLEHPAVAASGRRSTQARKAAALNNPRFVLVLGCLTVAFFTLPWTVFLVFLLPVAAVVTLMLLQARGRALRVRGARELVRAAALLMAVAMVGTLALSPTVWLPVRAVQLKEGAKVELYDQQVSGLVAAYVLSRDKDRTTLLLDSPRAVVDVATDQVEPDAPLCISEPSPLRPYFVRASQALGWDADPGSPYLRCPTED